VFQSWEWVASWYEHFGRDKQLQLLVARAADGKLVGVAPCSRSRGGLFRLLHLLGRGNDLTEYVQILAHPDYAQPVTRLVLDAWDRAADQWDLLVLPSVPEDSRFLASLRRQADARGYLLSEETHVRMSRSLPGSWEQFYRSLSKSMKDNVNNYVNRLRRAGHREEFVVVETLPEVEAALDGFFELHRRRSQTSKQRYQHHDKFADPKHRQFLRAAVRRLAARGQVWVCFLRVDDRPVAAQICFVDRDRLYPYYSGFDPQWWAYGVMVTLTRRCIERAIARGIPELDLMAGPYQDKRRWGGEPEPLVDLTLASPRWRSRASFALFRVYKARRTLGTGRILAAAALAAPLESYALAC
jgi:CelD/BcsL family acetyltransferase involved in cellulose biosynthesis